MNTNGIMCIWLVQIEQECFEVTLFNFFILATIDKKGDKLC